ncbi:MAG: GNAT family N-acetyltransferase [Alphaproteobacteria bacterium]|nr:GNAT family N-acetyltransferase [Alphaproteobacteria bacterium]
MKIRVDDLRSRAVADLLNAHLATMRAQSPPESAHALDLEQLRVPDVTFWTAWLGRELIGMGALKELNPQHGEIKSMHTRNTVRRRGTGQAILDHILSVARSRGYHRLSLETGSMAAFAPARSLYGRNGFSICSPFADYREDPNSVFMTRSLDVG